MDTPILISAIIPVYNTYKYLNRCIDSVLNQNIRNFEVLLIDDGSTDDSGVICDEYARRDTRIKVFHKENGGIGTARNLALKHALGKWVVFIDSDDWVSSNFFDCDFNDQVDVIEKSYKRIDDSSGKVLYEVNMDIPKILTGKQIPLYFINNRTNALWNKFFKREVIGNVRFEEQVEIGEDFFFQLELIPKIRKYSFSPIGEYYYITHVDSVMGKAAQNVNHRVDLIFINISRIRELSYGSDLKYIGESVLYFSYVKALFMYLPHLNANHLDYLLKLFKTMRWNNLRFLTVRQKIRLILYKYKFYLKYYL